MSWVVFHFLNVWAGDCTIVHFHAREVSSNGKVTKKKSERIMMIDFCHHENHEEYEHVIDYYKRTFKWSNGKPKPIFRYICTHPHHDHICWLHKLFDESAISISNFWCIDHSFKPESFDWHARHEDDRKVYEKAKNNKIWCTVLNYTRDTKQSDFWWDEEDRITILSPSKNMIDDAHKDSDWKDRTPSSIDIDHISYALMIQINSIKLILWWDSRLSAREDIKEHFWKKIEDIKILKAPHHGHYSAFEKKNWEESEFIEDIVKHMNPEYIVFSNSEEEDKKYWAEKEYKKICPDASILKTHDKWNIIIDCWFDGTISIL